LEPTTKENLQVAQDLLDTLITHKDACAGMAANMIGVRKRIIVFDNEGTYMTMFNPEIIKKSGPYDAEKGCLSLLGGPANANAIQTIKAQRKIAEFKTLTKSFFGWTVQIIRMKSTIAMVF
jgi:peptide deformylase